jgi:ribosome recycling factor
MAGAVESLKHDLSGLRTGRANTALLDPVMVEVYGSMMPLNQVATVSAPEPRMLSVQGVGPGQRDPGREGHRHANLGLNRRSTGRRCACDPDLTEERRKELAKLAGKYAEAPRSRSATSAATAWNRSRKTRRRRKSPRTSASARKTRSRS